VARRIVTETWRLITTWGAEPGFNMGLDEALLVSREPPPTVRFYTWRPDTLSLGYFQRLADVPAAGQAGALVRRITGGGAIHHHHELTFSLALDLDHPLYDGAVAASYERVHALVAAALSEFGIEARLRGARPLASDVQGTGMCFHHSTPLDLAWDDRKGVGSAQRRKGDRVLHHGSIKLDTTPLEGAIACVDRQATGLDAAAVAPALRRAIERGLDVRLEAGVPTAAERDAARRLGARYVDPAFVGRR
jgi:lipoate-protein ligase A